MRRNLGFLVGIGLAIAGAAIGLGMTHAIAKPRLNVMPDLQDETEQVLATADNVAAPVE